MSLANLTELRPKCYELTETAGILLGNGNRFVFFAVCNCRQVKKEMSLQQYCKHLGTFLEGHINRLTHLTRYQSIVYPTHCMAVVP